MSPAISTASFLRPLSGTAPHSAHAPYSTHRTPRSARTGADPRRLRVLLGVLFAALAVILLSSCADTDSTTELKADGSGTHTITVLAEASDLEYIEGGVATVESAINDNNPGGITYSGSNQTSESTTFTFVIEFSGPDDYEAKAKTLLEAGGITTTPEVLFTPPTPPFSGGYTFDRNFTDVELLNWVSEALVSSGTIEDSYSAGDVLTAGTATITAEGEELESGWGDGWTNAETRSFANIGVSTQGIENPEADSYTRTITYELPRETYLSASEEFDAFFEQATPEGGEFTAAGDAGTTWSITFPAGSAADVASWTDTALATTGSQLSVEAVQSEEDPFTFETRVVDSIDCAVACGDMGYVSQSFEVPAGWSGTQGANGADAGLVPVEHPGGPEPYTFSHTVPVEAMTVDLSVNPEGGGEATVVVSLTEEADALVTQEHIEAWLGEGAARETSDGLVAYSLSVSGGTAEEFTSALQKAGFAGPETAPVIEAYEYDSRKFTVMIDLSLPERIASKAPEIVTWAVTGDGLRPTEVSDAMDEDLTLTDDSITVESTTSGYLYLVFSAEQTGLPVATIIAIVIALALLGLLITALVIGFMYRDKLRAMLGSGSKDPADGPTATSTAPADESAAPVRPSEGAGAAPDSQPMPPEQRSTPPSDPTT